MKDNKPNFLEIIENQRKKKKKKKFSGNFLDYLKMVQDNPSIIKMAHKRLCDVIEDHNVSVMDESETRCRRLFEGDRVKIYHYFNE